MGFCHPIIKLEFLTKHCCTAINFNDLWIAHLIFNFTSRLSLVIMNIFFFLYLLFKKLCHATLQKKNLKKVSMPLLCSETYCHCTNNIISIICFNQVNPPSIVENLRSNFNAAPPGLPPGSIMMAQSPSRTTLQQIKLDDDQTLAAALDDTTVEFVHDGIQEGDVDRPVHIIDDFPR